MRRSLLWGSTRLALAVWCVLAGSFLLASAPALASGGPEAPEAPITDACSGPVPAGGGVEVCGKLNPGVKAKVGFYFAYHKGAVCTGGLETPLEPEVEVQDKEVSAELTGLEPDAEYTYCLFATNSVGETPSQPATFHTAPVPPAIQNVSVTEITDETATLEAQIDSENSETKYEVVLADPCPAPMECIRDVPLKSGEITAKSAGEYVRIELASNEHLNLEPNTTYEYWVAAENTDGQKTKVEKTFRTLKTPSIDGASATDITEHDAVLEAKINPAGQDVYYQFQIVKNPSEFLPEMACPAERSAELCLGSPPTTGALPIGFLLAGSADDTVSLDLERERGVTLQPETTYHYRVIALRSPASEDAITWKGPPAYGADQTFTTPGPQSTGLGFPTGSETVSGSGSGNVLCPNNVTSTGCAVADLTPTHPKRLTRAQKLARALKLCRKEHKSRRAKCEKAARKNYGPRAKGRRSAYH
jgi:hypothetical protein